MACFREKLGSVLVGVGFAMVTAIQSRVNIKPLNLILESWSCPIMCQLPATLVLKNLKFQSVYVAFTSARRPFSMSRDEAR